MAKGASVEKAVKEIRRKTRRRFSAEEKVRIVLEGIRLVEGSELSARRTLRELGVPRSTFYA